MNLRPKNYNDKGDKWCSACSDWHHPGYFGRRIGTKDGLTYECALSRRGRYKKNKLESEKMQFIEEIIVRSTPKLPPMKLTTMYTYERPDAYDIYINNINSNRK